MYELYARGRTYEEVHERNRASRHLWEKYITDTSFKFVVNGYNRTISKGRQREIIEDFAYMGFMGRIDLLSPEVTIGCFEECKLQAVYGGGLQCRPQERMALLMIFDVCYNQIQTFTARLDAREIFARYFSAGWCAEATESLPPSFRLSTPSLSS